MRVVLAHNRYTHAGGEDAVFSAESALLRAHGHTVCEYQVDNGDIAAMRRIDLAVATVWNSESYRELRELFRRARPDVVHFHNTLPLISPAAYYAAAAEGIGVVQTLHNYRMVCPTGTLLRDGAPCEKCVGKPIPWPAVLHGCYRGDRAASAVVATMLAVHRARGTYRNLVDQYIALTTFAKQKLVEGGMNPDLITVKPNFLAHDHGPGDGTGGYALFAGRLSKEKGLEILLEAWLHIGLRLPLRVAGDGPLADEVRGIAANVEGVTLLGQLGKQELARQMKGAVVQVVPSTWYEGLPMTVIEAFSAGTPVVAPSHGAFLELIRPGETGFRFVPGDASSLAGCILSILDHSAGLRNMRRATRLEYERTYSPDVAYPQIERIYAAATRRWRLRVQS